MQVKKSDLSKDMGGGLIGRVGGSELPKVIEVDGRGYKLNIIQDIACHDSEDEDCPVYKKMGHYIRPRCCKVLLVLN